MDRISVIQNLIDRIHARVYLEVGVQAGDTFFQVRAKKKMAVDPRFRISRRDKWNWLRWNFANLRNEYYEMPSDEFFQVHSEKLEERGLDLVFVDGLHTYEQSLRDVQNSLRFLRPGGIILIDDCNPKSEGAASPHKAPEQLEWNGDVWKTVADLRSTEPDLQVFVLDCVYGLGIVRRAPAENMLVYSPQQIEQLSYQDLDSDRAHILNLKNSAYFAGFLTALQ